MGQVILLTPKFVRLLDTTREGRESPSLFFEYFHL